MCNNLSAKPAGMKQVLVAWRAPSLYSSLSLLLRSSGICWISKCCKRRWGPGALGMNFCLKWCLFHSVGPAKGSAGESGDQSFRTWRFLGVFCILFSSVSGHSPCPGNKIYFGLFPPVLVSQMCYSYPVVVWCLPISLTAKLELPSASLNHWSNLVWDPERRNHELNKSRKGKKNIKA